MTASYCILPNRGVLKIEGEDRLEFLQGLISNDVNKINEHEAIYAAFLTPQGKFLCDFFIAQENDALLIDIERDALASFKKKLTMYKLRANVTIKDVSEDYKTVAFFGTEVAGEGIFIDPRLAEAGFRAVMTNDKIDDITKDANEVAFEQYDLHRIKLGLPDGSRDMIVEKSILLENGFDELNGVNWDKGCYMGQELTARTKYRALIKKRLFPVSSENDLPASGSDIIANEKNVGTLHSTVGNFGLATLKLDALDHEITCDGVKLTIHHPNWMQISREGS